MYKRRYNLLVRDKVPQAIIDGGDKPYYYVIEKDEDYRAALDDKLDEELVDYQVTKELAELADVLEVLHAIVEAEGATFEELDQMRLAKRERRGGFSKRYLLEMIDESNTAGKRQPLD